MSSDSQWHVERSKQILKNHPEIKNYFGNYPLSVVYILFLVVLQWSVAWLVRDLSWWIVGLVALLVGQFILHSLSVFIHEAAHNLIIKGKIGSNISLFLIELGSLSFGKSLTYISKHGKSHHMHLNDYLQDYEWWDRQQAEFTSSKPWWRFLETLVHLIPGGVVVTEFIVDWLIPADARQCPSFKKSPSLNLLLITTSFMLYALAWRMFSWQASLYLLWSLTLMVGNWGITFKGQSICEHHIYQEGKTYSTYSWTNIVFFNTGYHDEHHTFPNIPWIYLPKVKQIAPEYFTNENPHSYFYWWWIWAKSVFAPAQFNRYISKFKV